MSDTFDRSAAFLRLCQRRPHFAVVALMGTAKHLRDVHGVEHPPTEPLDLARAHVEAHGHLWLDDSTREVGA